MEACLPMNLAFPMSVPAESDDGALVRRSIAGDMRAFELLYRKHVGRVHGAILRLVGMDHARADELTQEAFVKAWQKLSGFRFERAFFTWLFRLGVNTALMELRGRGDERNVEAEVLELAAGGEVPFCAGERSDLERVEANLPPRRRLLAPLALAASVLVAAAAFVHMLSLQRTQDAPSDYRADTALPALQRADAQLKAVPNRDPRLAGAVIAVDAATRQLQPSLQEQPDAVFLVGLLNRTYERRVKLARLGRASS